MPTKYERIHTLVERIQYNWKNNCDSEEEIEELLEIYKPLVYNILSHLSQINGTSIDGSDYLEQIKSHFLELVMKYNPAFKREGEENVEGFQGVYFSWYLKTHLKSKVLGFIRLDSETAQANKGAEERIIESIDVLQLEDDVLLDKNRGDRTQILGILEIIAKLWGEKKKDIFIAHYLLNFTQVETGGIIGMKQTPISFALKQIKQNLRNILGIDYAFSD